MAKRKRAVETAAQAAEKPTIVLRAAVLWDLVFLLVSALVVDRQLRLPTSGWTIFTMCMGGFTGLLATYRLYKMDWKRVLHG